MRFKRYPNHAFEWTRRKELAAVRKLAKVRERAPLFADQIAELQPSIEQVRSARVEAWDRTDRSMRDRRARHWREVRARLALVPAGDRLQLRRYWDEHPAFPGDLFYLSYVVRRYEAEGLASIAPVKPAHLVGRAARG